METSGAVSDRARDCYACAAELVDGVASVEHIIPNAIGGRLKSRALLCRDCNSRFGDTIDAALSRQLLPVANALNVQRERGATPSVRVTFDEEEYVRDANGNMRPVDKRPTVIEGESSATFSFSASTLAQARKHLEGLKRKYPKLDVEAQLAAAKLTVTRVDAVTEFNLPSIGGDDMFRAVVKIALSYFLHIGGAAASVPVAVAAVLNPGDPGLRRVGCLYGVDPIPERDISRVLHVVAVISDLSGRLSAYVELLGAYRFAVRLSNRYSGPPISSAYAYDVCAQAVIALDATRLIGLPWLHEGMNQDAVAKALDVVRDVAVARSQEAWGPMPVAEK